VRQIVLDTETTGIDPSQGHRIIEIGCVEIVDRRLTGHHYHQYINPERVVEAEAIEVHGITNEYLEDKPRFADIVDQFLEFVGDDELVIHNAPFDLGFLNHEIRRINRSYQGLEDKCSIVDTLVMARAMHPGQKNNLDALCRRYGVDNSNRELHGALLDSEILADVYLLLTGGQTDLGLVDNASAQSDSEGAAHNVKLSQVFNGRVIVASDEELARHTSMITSIDEGLKW